MCGMHQAYASSTYLFNIYCSFVKRIGLAEQQIIYYVIRNGKKSAKTGHFELQTSAIKYFYGTECR